MGDAKFRRTLNMCGCPYIRRFLTFTFLLSHQVGNIPEAFERWWLSLYEDMAANNFDWESDKFQMKRSACCDDFMSTQSIARVLCLEHARYQSTVAICFVCLHHHHRPHDSASSGQKAVITDATLVSHAAARLDKAEKSTLRKNTAVPSPKTTLLMRTKGHRELVECKQMKRVARYINHDIRLWRQNAPVYCMKGVNLASLQRRPKNGDKEKFEAQAVINEMQCWESDGTSALFEDEDGKPLVAYFARRRKISGEVAGAPVYYVPGPSAPSSMGRSVSCLDEAAKAGEVIYFDGIGRTLLEKTLVAMQLLVHHVGVRKVRGMGDMTKALDGGPPAGIAAASQDKKGFVLDGIEYVYQDCTFVSEATGVMHLVHGWPEQGRNAEKDTEQLALLLGAMFHEAFPDFYAKYVQAFKAGKWMVVDPGPFLGRAIDGLDEGPAVIFPMGHFSGGECYIPDLRLKLIQPDRLKISAWLMDSRPWRVGDKPAGWSVDTVGGRLGDLK
ncbi:hypothetical protein BDR03DRAFT_986545 [Suillus americanus]|nr:hypothetical protein BDR03DRAFT_986545 [Suillus americanus]